MREYGGKTFSACFSSLRLDIWKRQFRDEIIHQNFFIFLVFCSCLAQMLHRGNKRQGPEEKNKKNPWGTDNVRIPASLHDRENARRLWRSENLN